MGTVDFNAFYDLLDFHGDKEIAQAVGDALTDCDKLLLKNHETYKSNAQEDRLEHFFIDVEALTEQYRDEKPETQIKSNKDESSANSSLLKNWRDGGGNKIFAKAVYYFFHVAPSSNDEAYSRFNDPIYAKRIDRALFGKGIKNISFEDHFDCLVPGKNYPENYYIPPPPDFKHKPDHRTLKNQKDIEDFIDRNLEDHEPHDIEACFEDFMQQNEQGYWYLTAGPGVGKTAIMASIAKSLGEKCIPYFFSFSISHRDENKPNGYYNYIFSRLKDEYGLDVVSSGKNHETFAKHLQKLDETGAFSKKPLILIIDSIDEMTGASNTVFSAKDQEKLGLPQRLPKGVYVAISERRSESIKAGLFDDMQAVCLHSPEYKHTQENTVKRYANKKSADKNPTENTIQQLCTDADYNFLIVKGVVNAPECWENGKLTIKVTPIIADFYKNYLHRVFKVYGYEGLRGMFSLSLNYQISANLFWDLVGAENQDKYQSETLGAWKKQGLVKQEQASTISYLSVYHETFFRFLQDDAFPVLNPDRIYPFDDALIPCLKNLQTVFDNKKQAISASLTSEYFRVLLRLIKASQNSKLLHYYLNDFDFWEDTFDTDLGINVILAHVTNIAITSESERVGFENAAKKMITSLFQWVEDKKLHNHEGEPYSKKNIIEFLHPDIGGNSDNNVEAKRHIRKLQSSGKIELDQESELLLSIKELKDARIERKMETAHTLLNKIEGLLSSADRNTYSSYWSEFLYQKAYLLYMEDKIEQAIEIFDQTAKHAEKYDGLLRRDINLRMSITYKYLGGLCTARDAYKECVKLVDGFDNKIYKGQEALYKSAEYNLYWWLMILAFEADQVPDYAKWAEKFMRTEQMQDYDNTDNRLLHLRVLSKDAYTQQEYTRAIGILAFLLDIPYLSNFPFPSALEGIRGASPENANQNNPEHGEMVCRDYVVLAKALNQLPQEKRDNAKTIQVLNEGLTFETQPGNIFYIRQIRSMIEELEEN